MGVTSFLFEFGQLLFFAALGFSVDDEVQAWWSSQITWLGLGKTIIS